jgi:hypothetical protein
MADKSVANSWMPRGEEGATPVRAMATQAAIAITYMRFCEMRGLGGER